MKPKTHRLAPFKISSDTWEGLRRLSVKEETSISSIARRFLREGVQREFGQGARRSEKARG